MRSHVYLITTLLLIVLHSVLIAQRPFGEQSRNTDIIVKVQPTVLQLPERRNEVLPEEAVINIPELSGLLSRHNLRFILRSFPDADPADTIMINESGHTIRLLDRTSIFRFRFPPDTDLLEVVKELHNTPGIIFAETIPEYEFGALPPDDQYFETLQWNLNHTGVYPQPPLTSAGRADIRALEAWEIYKGSPSIKIGIIDSGVRLTHEDLSAKVTGDPHTDGHGTAVAGIAAAITNNEKGIAGVDWNAQIISRDISSFEPEIIYDKILSAINEGSHVINNSWGGTSMGTLERRAFSTAYKMNVVPVAITHNQNSATPRYPAALQNVIAVGASNHENRRSGYSNYGDYIDVVAPGGWGSGAPDLGWNIRTTFAHHNSAYGSVRGTSYAAPHVSGLSSLLRGYAQDSLGITLYNDDIRWIIRLSADEVVATIHMSMVGISGWVTAASMPSGHLSISDLHIQ